MVRLAFDVYAPPVTSLGSRLVRLTDQEYGPGTFYEHSLGGVGVGRLVVERDQAVLTAANFAIGNYVLVRDLDLSATDTLNVIGGFFLERGDFALVTDPGRSVLRFGGPSTIAYLARAVMGPEAVSPFSGPHSIVDGYWRWGSDTYGGVLRRAIYEANGQRTDPGDPVGTDEGLPMINAHTDGVTVTGDGVNWDDNDDSNGDPWPAFSGEFRTQAGTNLLALAAELFGYGIEWDIDARTFDIFAYNAGGFGTDHSATVQFRRDADNIAQELTRSIRGQLPLTHVLVRTTDHPEGAWIESDTYSPGDPVRKGTYQTGDISGDPAASTVLQDRVQRLIDIRGLAEDGVSFFTSKPGTTGTHYQPGPNYSPGATATGGDYWVGDYVQLDSGGDDIDYNDAVKRIETIAYELSAAGEWDVRINIGPRVGSGTTDLSGPVGATPIGLADPTFACRDLVAAQLDAETGDTNGNAENGSGTEWSGGSYSTTMFHAGIRGYSRSGDGTLTFAFDPSKVFSAGTRYVVDAWVRIANDHLGTTLTVGSGGDTATDSYPGASGTDPPGTFIDTETGADGEQWGLVRVCWTPSEDRTAVELDVTIDVSSGSWAVDDVALYTTTVSGITGTETCAARCDHSHIHSQLDSRNAPDAHSAAAISFDPTGTSTAETTVQEALEDALAAAGYSDEQAQDAVGTILTDSSTIDFTYTDATPAITAVVLPGGIPIDTLGSPSDISTLNASTAAHGLLRKLDNDATHYLDGTGAWSEPAAGTGGVLPWIIPPPWGLLHRAMQNLGANNRCIFWPVVVPKACTITGLRLRVGTASGTMGVAMYDESLSTRIATSGSVSTPASGLQTVSFSSPAVVAAGRYWFAMSCSTTSASFSIADDNSTASPAVGKFQDTAHPPPSSPSGLADTVRNPNAFGVISGISGYP